MKNNENYGETAIILGRILMKDISINKNFVIDPSINSIVNIIYYSARNLYIKFNCKNSNILANICFDILIILEISLNNSKFEYRLINDSLSTSCNVDISSHIQNIDIKNIEKYTTKNTFINIFYSPDIDIYNKNLSLCIHFDVESIFCEKKLIKIKDIHNKPSTDILNTNNIIPFNNNTAEYNGGFANYIEDFTEKIKYIYEENKELINKIDILKNDKAFIDYRCKRLESTLSNALNINKSNNEIMQRLNKKIYALEGSKKQLENDLDKINIEKEAYIKKINYYEALIEKRLNNRIKRASNDAYILLKNFIDKLI